MDIQVTVSEGTIRGKACTTPCGKKYYSFEGIPYAKPPVGPLRFKNPQKIEKWSGVLDATEPGSKCLQMNLTNGSIEGSEDCLYLNVYTPYLPCEEINKLPVLFFIHGGRWSFGYGSYYRPDYLIREDVVIVTINYRLHIFGFLCLHMPEVPGNAGLKDAVMALRWVKDNIGYFNGDDGNITAFGESVGAAMATTFLVSNMTDGLISKVIAQSGNCLSDLFIVESDPVEKAKELALNIGKNVTRVEELYEVLLQTPAEDLVKSYMMSELKNIGGFIAAFLQPVVEREYANNESFLTEYPLVSIRNNRFRRLPCLITMASHEGALFLNRDDTGDIVYGKNLKIYIPKYSFIDEKTKRACEIERKLKTFYFQENEIGPETLRQYVDIVSDGFFARDLVYYGETLCQYQNNVYFCRFAYPGNMNTRVMKKLAMKGATHGDIVQYLFYKKAKSKMCTDNDVKVIRLLTRAWCNFAKTGIPSWTNQEVEWLPYEKKQRLCLNISENGAECIPLPEFSRVKFWLDLVGDRSKL